jgi:hypothetical protein
MASISRQIGWSNESNLLYQILKQLTRLTSVVFGLKPKYKVYTALLTQSGGDSPNTAYGDGTFYKGVTYTIVSNPLNEDATFYGAPNNNDGTSFICNQTISPGQSGSFEFSFNDGAPVVTVLENTIGDVWFEFYQIGSYYIKSNSLFITDKTTIINGSGWDTGDIENILPVFTLYQNITNILIQSTDRTLTPIDNVLHNTLIEIRVYS